MIPGEYRLRKEPITINVGRTTQTLIVANLGDRPIQVGSHCHFFEVNSSLSFDREQAYGMRLNIVAGTAIRFEPGDSKEVEVVAVGGERRIFGINSQINGELDNPKVKENALTTIQSFEKKESDEN